MRASRAVAPDGVTSRGLISSSAISGWAAAYLLSWATTPGGGGDVDGRPAAVLAEQRRGAQPAAASAWPRPRRTGAERDLRRRAAPRSPYRPCPTSTVGPKRGSQRAPTISSTPSRRSAISSTEKAGGSSRCTSSLVRGHQRRRPRRGRRRRRRRRTCGGGPAPSGRTARRSSPAAAASSSPLRISRAATKRRQRRRTPAATRCSRSRRPGLPGRACGRRSPSRAGAAIGGQRGSSVLDGGEHRHPAFGQQAGRPARQGRSTALPRACRPLRRRRSPWRPRTRPGPSPVRPSSPLE